MTLQRANWLSLGAVLLAAALSGRPAEAQVARPEWWDAAWRYRALVSVPAKGPGAYRAWIFAGDRAKPDGSDIRVVAPTGPGRGLRRRPLDAGRAST